MPVTIIGWIVFGIIAGFIASKIVNKSGAGVIMDLCLGIVGAVVGGFLFEKLGYGPSAQSGLIYSMFVAVVGAVIVLFLYHLLTGRRSPGTY